LQKRFYFTNNSRHFEHNLNTSNFISIHSVFQPGFGAYNFSVCF